MVSSPRIGTGAVLLVLDFRSSWPIDLEWIVLSKLFLLPLAFLGYVVRDHVGMDNCGLQILCFAVTQLLCLSRMSFLGRGAQSPAGGINQERIEMAINECDTLLHSSCPFTNRSSRIDMVSDVFNRIVSSVVMVSRCALNSFYF